MSKAILVFDGYETLKKHYGEEVVIYINIPVKSKNGKIKGYQYHSTERAVLKPIPEKKNYGMGDIKVLDCVTISEEAINMATHQIEQRVNYDVNRLMAKGYNDCIDEILGEENG